MLNLFEDLVAGRIKSFTRIMISNLLITCIITALGIASPLSVSIFAPLGCVLIYSNLSSGVKQYYDWLILKCFLSESVHSDLAILLGEQEFNSVSRYHIDANNTNAREKNIRVEIANITKKKFTHEFKVSCLKILQKVKEDAVGIYQTKLSELESQHILIRNKAIGGLMSDYLSNADVSDLDLLNISPELMSQRVGELKDLRLVAKRFAELDSQLKEQEEIIKHISSSSDSNIELILVLYNIRQIHELSCTIGSSDFISIVIDTIFKLNNLDLHFQSTSFFKQKFLSIKNLSLHIAR